MEANALIAFLAFATFACVIAFAIISKQRTERRMEDDKAPKSALAKDGPDH